MAFNLSHYYYVANEKPFPEKRDDVKWTNNIDDERKSVIDNIIGFDPFKNGGKKINGIKYIDYFCPGFNKKLIQCFKLTTTYPGLLIGTGYSHEALKRVENDKEDEGDFQLGFFFDHTTGLPVIPGSSIKGVLRDVFPKKNDKSEIVKSKLKYINNKINNGFVINEANFQNIFFERKQIFFDAYISGIKDENFVILEKKEYKINNGKKRTKFEERKISKLLGDDYITPHTEGIFKNPIPIRFLKVMPGVTFTFQFLLKDYKKSDKLKSEGKKLEGDEILLGADKILKIFYHILLDFGVGAKRNVGYGQWKGEF